MLALVFIRKLLDFCFSNRELSYLDDLMPESKKKKLDDDSKKAVEVCESYAWFNKASVSKQSMLLNPSR